MAAVLALCLAGAACRSLRETEAEPANDPAPAMKVPVGIVHLSQAGSGFVLIRTARFLSLAPGTPLVTVNAQGVETAWLEASEARQGSFLSADIRGGAPSVGDQVLMDYRSPLPGAGPTDDPFAGEGARQVLE